MTCRSASVAPALFAALLVAGCGGQERAAGADRPPAATPFDLSAMRRVIQEQNDRFTRAHVAGDVATIDAMFTRDATSFPPGADPAIGPAAIHALTMDYLRAGVTAFREQSTDVYGNEDLVVDHGTYTMTYGPDHVVERGKYLNVWRREDGAWKIHANIWNTSPPAPDAK
ncbi:MAG: DUF4440 domain-containing protein [Vicinamibacterales bacterium]